MYYLLLLLSLSVVYGDHHFRTNMLPDRTSIVHLFEWKWKDIAEECERFLAPHGFGGVQISPPSENLIIHLNDGSRTWYERYQVMSYKLKTRSGDENQFLDMTRRCNKVGVRIYADVVMNHMTGDNPNNIGTGGSTADFQKYEYPGVPYHQEHFHYPYCSVKNYNNATEVRSCNLFGLKDLNHDSPHVQNRISDFLNHLISLGVTGFRVDAAKHMWPNDLKKIYEKLNSLNTDFGFAPNTRPYIYQEVLYYGNEDIRPSEYTSLGDVTEFRAAIAFMLSQPYGITRIMSSYFFDTSDQGPPEDYNENIISPTINGVSLNIESRIYWDDTCGNGWVCEHRWRQIYQMVAFRNVVKNEPVQNWWDNGNNQIAYSRGNKGFIVFNLEGTDFNQRLKTGLPEGEYCDVISGKRKDSSCSGSKITVGTDGYANIVKKANEEDIHLAIHVGKESKL
ncbi:alpha-amylase 2-like isoform X2 [Plodia interpunctella]|uniref:alpha-amylase 2-like isoform X2 n=1 Tax=Plodia interpunctella TaxID=58824 RepID=UPI0023685B0B|nr:alpha-amylase 2-like isoform X2 [Plodia interpunctella]